MNSNQYNLLVSEAIKACRELNVKTQEEVADAIGMSRSNYCKLEAGKRQITIGLLFIIAKELKTNIFQILTFVDSKNKIENNTTTLSKMLIDFVRLSNLNLNVYEIHELILMIKTTFKVEYPRKEN